MITYNYETEFALENETQLENWIEKVVSDKEFELGEVNYIFCDDEYLLKLNVEFLQHDTLTDIISFDNSLGKLINGDIFISIERVQENAKEYNVTFEEELHRVMIHGILHYMGLKDKSADEKMLMRKEENKALSVLKF
ncbi:rRNA maturation RNase YbeY [Polaribacter vadi]|uniref:Endoribonuclease YbeY n=1 Tax=Polaribacter vadi TaxID=1774273 RepID=A0A1B8TSZ3_9FLAO|nr:rRNA maturation RNase YbeY [Polaribacter vadi]AOW17898.1 rRNA maturation RNase YbeY [Polaribacter vadi]OBY62624.1 rRNA maturation factor [Polaribacter vadi]|tara:strand:- start:8 stop:421 length:414 start_codon:yes stop_codon:yes gene_type:complete